LAHTQRWNIYRERRDLLVFGTRGVPVALMYLIYIGIPSLEHYLHDRLVHGRSYFSREQALKALSIAPRNFTAAATRLNQEPRPVSICASDG
jgi:hypothetical protein